MVQLCHEWNDEKITYYTEEPKSIWKARLSKFPQGLSHVTLVFALGCNPEDIRNDIREGPGAMAVIDTTRNLLNLTDENENTSLARELLPYVAASRQSAKTLWFIHHARKGGGEQGESIAGGHAFLGAVDIALELSRDKSVDNRRKLRGWARVIAVPELIYERNDDGYMVALGDPAKVSREAVKTSISDVLPNEWTPIRDVLSLLEEPRPGLEQTRMALKDLASKGDVERYPAISDGDKPGATYYWRKPAT